MADPILVVHGEDVTFGIDFSQDGAAYDFTGATMRAQFPRADDSGLTITDGDGIEVDLVITNRLNFTLSAARSAKLKVGERLGFEVEITKAGAKAIIQFPHGLDVRRQLY